jgi:hypothetical protein
LANVADRLTKNSYRDTDVILGHEFDKRLKSFASYYSQSFLLESIDEYHFVEPKKEGRKPDTNSSLRRLKFMPRNLKKNSPSRIPSQNEYGEYGGPVFGLSSISYVLFRCWNGQEFFWTWKSSD